MEEREALKRQIELLQNLINTHKSVHGDTPFARDEWSHPEAPTSARGRGHSTSVVHPHSSRGGLYAPQSRGSWRKTYSLSNKNPQPSVGHPSASASSTVHQSGSHRAPHSTSLPSHSRGEEGQRIVTATLSSGIPQQKEERPMNSITGGVAAEKRNTDTLRKTGAAVSLHEDGNGCSRSTGTSEQRETMHRQTPGLQERTEIRRVVLPEKSSSEVASSVKANVSTSLQSIPQARIKPTKTCVTSTESKPTVTKTTPAVPNANTVPPLAALPNVSKHSIDPASPASQGQVNASFLKKSKFTWVKSQKQASSSSSPTGKAVAVALTSVSKAGVASGSSPLFTGKRTPGKKFPRKLSPLNAAPKTSKYRWVSISAGAQAKIPRKSISPKALTLSQRALEKGEVPKKLRAEDKMKKGAAGSSTSSSPVSRYRWKAGGQSTSGAAIGGATVARRRSAFHWTSERSNKGVKGVSPSVSQRFPRTYLMPPSSPAGFKLRSRMKIIRKSPTGGSGSEMKYSPRGRMHSSSRSPAGARRTPSRELVSFGRHKLRRLSPTSSRTSKKLTLQTALHEEHVFCTQFSLSL
ncbi:zinc finger CCCH domain-containing protein 3-like, partial [Anarrhichthys ocellatus]|uniref:zinc finger CCCH domain-containing protein 3-like n=1 Tax=Anarrhichthys ocellatus TaxID=433405 RepID=UPI0012EE619E